ncbi:MAG: hypothetical protein ACI85U_001519 [Candidatus Promineifilaceae bacterium]|jgi:hypothetical protein
MSTPQAHPRPTIDVNRNGIQSRFEFELEETPTQKEIKAIKKKEGKKKSRQLQLMGHSKKDAPQG